ncbi:MAG: RNA-binding protein [Mariprofundaceae bacterium]|nr:RNA-binding protein [Mariprofundaceae bacterium]
MNIYVGNLSFRSTEDDLRDVFAEFGDVESVKIITDRETGRSRGFAFIEMSSDEGAANAIASLNGQDHLGRDLTVNEARPRPNRF